MVYYNCQEERTKPFELGIALMEWRIGFCGTPSKNFSKKFEKPLDKYIIKT